MYTVEYREKFGDYTQVVIMDHKFGSRCGYVSVPELHCLYNVGYAEPTPNEKT